MTHVIDLLKQTKKLSDGSYGNIFSQFKPIFNCHLCRIKNIPDFEALMAHAISTKHQQKVADGNVPNAMDFNASLGRH